ncbi:acidic amino acid decarboxylase GADL1-like [Teleopsis dalmanni]|nr:acidic amino acid decarboxylase GADL1-like [Teleopsis dalmanni]
MSNSTIVDEIRCKLTIDWKVLGSIYDLLCNEKAFCVSEADRGEKIVNFVQPEELKKLIDLTISEHENHSIKDIEDIIRSVIKYSVKTSHGRFHNQLFGQMDPYGLAGTWISEALNTSA